MNPTKQQQPPRAIVMGASSGIGQAVALHLVAMGWQVGVAARREDRMQAIARLAPERVLTATIDITHSEAETQLLALIQRLGGMDYYFHISGVGHQNQQLAAQVELNTVATNGDGFARMVGAAFRYFATTGGGHITAVSSIAGTKGLGAAPAYSATKAFQNVYLQALEQLAHMRGLKIGITDVRPGFVATPLLGDGRHYPMLLRPERVARAIVGGTLRGQHVLTVDWRYRLLVAAWRLLPNGLWRRLRVSND